MLKNYLHDLKTHWRADLEHHLTWSFRLAVIFSLMSAGQVNVWLYWLAGTVILLLTAPLIWYDLRHSAWDEIARYHAERDKNPAN